MTDLTTEYLGLRLRSPIVASSSPFTGHLALLRRLDRAGAGAVVLPSIFQEQLDSATLTDELTGALARYNGGPEQYLRLIERAKRELRAPVIASLNVVVPGPWSAYLPRVADAGADAVELSMYSALPDPSLSAEALERRFADMVAAAVAVVGLPVSVKLQPQISAVSHLTVRLAAAGAAGVTLFNRYYQPDVQAERATGAPALPLSSPDEAVLAIRWIAALHGRVGCSLAAGGGIHSVRDVVKALLAGADAVMTTSALLRYGPEHVETLRAGLARWMQERGLSALAQMRGQRSFLRTPDPGLVFRHAYLAALAVTGEPTYWEQRSEAGSVSVDVVVR